MPDNLKEATKLVVETSGIFSSLWEWIVGIIGTGLAGLWLHITGRVKAIEDNIVLHAHLKEHIQDEEEKFSTLFTKADKMSETLTVVRESVARIEGILKQ